MHLIYVIYSTYSEEKQLLFRGRLLINPSLLCLKVPFFCNICELNLRAAMKGKMSRRGSIVVI